MLSNLILMIILSNVAFAINFNAYVDTQSPIRTISDPSRFLSVSLDFSMYGSPNLYGLNYTFITPLAKALGPLYFRFGGTVADVATFQDNQNIVSKINITGPRLDEIYNFSINAGWSIIYDLNQLLRNGSDIYTSTWDSTNAQELINYASQRGYQLNFELGNEPEYYLKNFNKSLTGEQIANAYRELRNLLNSNNLYKNSIIIGPSTSTYATALSSKEKKILDDFLSHGGGNYINALSFHYYYFAGATATLEDFLNVTIMDNLKSAILDVKNQNYTPMWLGETSSAFNDGAVGLSESYAAGFLWLDKLGLSALHGLDVVVRQDLFGGNYAVLNGHMNPTPDYWLSLLHKKLVGGSIFNITFDPINPNLRIYAASSADKNGITIYGQWMSNYSFNIDFPQISNKQVTAYILKEGETGNLSSMSSRLNGGLLSWSTHQPGPNIRGNVTNLPLELPGYSQFFITLNQTQSTQCPSGWYKESVTTNKCIRIKVNTMPLFGANFDCGIYGNNATLLSITSSFENAEIQKVASTLGSIKLFIGLTRSGNSWTWLNGDSSSYTNWQNGYPTNENTKNCVYFDSDTGTWYNGDCDNIMPYICQIYV